MAGEVGVAAGGAQVAGTLAEILGALVLLGLAAGVDALDDGHVLEDLALLHILHQADAEAARVGGDDVAAVVAGGLDELAAIHLDVAKVDVLREAGGDVVNQHVPEAGVQLGTLEDEDTVLVGELGVVDVEVELTVLGEDDAVDGVALLAVHLDELEVLLNGGAGVVGRHGVAMQVEVGQGKASGGPMQWMAPPRPPTGDYRAGAMGDATAGMDLQGSAHRPVLICMDAQDNGIV